MENKVFDVAFQVNEILSFVRETAQGMEIGEVERELLARVMEIGRSALEEFVAVKGTGYVGKETVDYQGRRCPYVRERSRAYRSVFGTIHIWRSYYQAPGEPGVFPLDGILNLPERRYSYLLQELCSRLTVKMSYEDAQDIMSSFLPVKMPIRSLEGIVMDVCDETNGFYEELKPPDLDPESVITVVTVDKKGIVIRKPSEDVIPPINPDKPGKKKMATVISTYGTPRHFRTTQDIINEVNRRDSGSRPKPRNKFVWGSLIDGPEKTVARLKNAADQRLAPGNELVCILDGERSLWSLVYSYFPNAFFVLDIFHVLEYLGKAALCFHVEESEQARNFVTERLKMLLNGRAGRLIGGLKQMLVKHKLSIGKRRTLNRVIGYLERNRKHMRYEICLAKGYPIGSGVVEGACRNLINDRLELTGMRWIPQGAESIMRLRSVHINKDWSAFWSHRRKSERLRRYGTDGDGSQEIRNGELLRAA